MIRIEHLNKYYNKGAKNEYHVINDISYEFDSKGLYVFFGPSGCGKTTLLNVLGALDSFDSGSIIYEDQVFNKYSPKTADEFRNRNIGYIFQNYNLISSKNVYENVEVILDIIGIKDKDEKKKRIKASLEAVGMYKYRKRNVTALSGGQRQRVAIARALAKNPKIILADEPTGNLDSNNTFEVMNIIKSISKDRLVILVSHEKDLVDFYADEIIELKDGVITNDRKNNGEGAFSHNDSRNIYLKDYSKKDYEDDNYSLSSYTKGESEPLHFDVVNRNGEIYIRALSDKKIHYIDKESEIKLLDKSEEEFVKDASTKDANFSFNDFKEEESDHKGYISFFKSVKDSFKGSKFLKKSVFSRIVLVIVGIVFAFMFSSLSSSISVKKTDYIKTPDNVVEVTFKHKDKVNGLTYATLLTSLKNDDNYISMTGTDYEINQLSVDLNRFYQTKSLYYSSSYDTFTVYYSKTDENGYTLKEGSYIKGEGEVVISSWVADDILSTTDAKVNGFTEYSDLIGVSSLEKVGSESKEVTIVGISSDESPVTYISSASYIQATDFSADSSVYISCKDKAKMMETIKSLGYSTVEDPIKNAGWKYFKCKISENASSVVTIGVMIIAIIVYLALLIRASLFAKIKDIGILRSVGATKKDIQSIFLGEMFSLTTITEFIGYTVMYLIIRYFSSNYSVTGLNFVNPDVITYFIGLILIYLVNEISALIPVAVLMHKTPVEIIKKYDI